MTELEISTGKGSEWEFGKIRLDEAIQFNLEVMSKIKTFCSEFGDGEWMYEAIRQANLEMNNCEKKAIHEAELELKKAKDTMKEYFPVRYKWSYYKVILKNPIKTLYAKWLLRSK